MGLADGNAMDRFRTNSHTTTVTLSQDAALVTALAGTAMPFAHSTQDQVERWLRAMRLHGRVGAAMQALGVGEVSLVERDDSADPAAISHPDPDAAQHVLERADEIAIAHRASTLGTVDLLSALFDVYGPLMEGALYERGASRDELMARIAEMDERAETAAL